MSLHGDSNNSINRFFFPVREKTLHGDSNNSMNLNSIDRLQLGELSIHKSDYNSNSVMRERSDRITAWK